MGLRKLIRILGLRGFWALGAQGIILGRGRGRRVAGQSTNKILQCCFVSMCGVVRC
jgi:hypothetical protein